MERRKEWRKLMYMYINISGYHRKGGEGGEGGREGRRKTVGGGPIKHYQNSNQWFTPNMGNPEL